MLNLPTRKAAFALVISFAVLAAPAYANPGNGNGNDNKSRPNSAENHLIDLIV